MFKKVIISSFVIASIWFLWISTYAQQQNLDEILWDILWDTETETEKLDEKTVWEVHGTAADILEQLDDGNRSYANNNEAIAEVVKTEENSVTLHTTKALYKGNEVTTYKVFYSKTMLSSQKFSDIESKTIKGTIKWDKVEILLDWLSTNTTYYAVIAPINPEDASNEPLDKITGEIRFRTNAENTNNTWSNNTWSNNTWSNNTWSNNTWSNNTWNEEIAEEIQPVIVEPKIELTNISYTTKNNNIEVKRVSQNAGDESVEISIRHMDDLSFSPVWKIKASTQIFSFSVDKPGSYFIKMKVLDTNGKQIWADKDLNLKINEFEEDITPTVTNPPKVGPTTDILIALMLFAAMIYIVYRVRRVENK